MNGPQQSGDIAPAHQAVDGRPPKRRATLWIIEIGLLAYLLTIPFGQSFPSVIRQMIVLAILGGLLAHAWARQRGTAPPTKLRDLLPAGVFCVSALLSIVFSCDRALSVHASQFFPLALLFFIAVQHVGTDPRFVPRLCAALWCVIIALSLDGLSQYVFGESLLAGAPLWGGRLRGSIPHPNDYGLIPVCLPLAFVVLTMAGLGAWRWLILLSVPAVVAALILSQSRNAWLGLGVGGVAWVVLGRQRWVMVVILLGAAVLFGVAWLLDVGQIQGRIAATANPLAEGRIGIWLAAWEMFKDAPLLGQGPHVFGELYVDYLGRAALPDGYVAELGYMPWAHCIYLELLCERGVLGFGAFGLMLAAMGRRLLAARRRATTMTTHSYAVGLTASLLVFMAMGVLDLTFLKDWVTLVFWMLAALAATAPQAVTASERRASGNPPARARRQA